MHRTAILMCLLMQIGAAHGQEEKSAPGVVEILTKAEVAPLPIVDGIAPVTPANTLRDPYTGMIEVALLPELSRQALPVIAPDNTAPHAGVLRRLVSSGKAAGLWDVVYDNRDNGHSDLKDGAFPQVSRSRYDKTFKAQNLDHGLAGRVLFSLPVVGNSSTALTKGPLARSLGRLALADQANALRSYRLYTSNQMYVYPEHHDYDPEKGDLLLANTPFFMLSKGSSYRDQPFVQAQLTAIAALRPDTKAELVNSGLLAPTVQMMVRRTLVGVNNEADYMSPIAHPPVFSPAQLRLGALVGYANSLQPEDIPPLVKIDVVQDLSARPGTDYLSENLGEVLFTTPSAVARVWRSFAFSRRITVSTADTQDPNGHTLQFHWAVLQGDPDRIKITPRAEDESLVDIDITWHDRFVPQANSGLMASRIDIAAFADNGRALSAPAVVSVVFPTHQSRVYAPDSQGNMRLREITYTPRDPADSYADPTLWPVADWRDRLTYDAGGRLAGLERTDLSGGGPQQIDWSATGWNQITETGVSTIHHIARTGPKGALVLLAQ